MGTEAPDLHIRQRAADLGRSVFLSAGAGTGKTTVLVARYMAALEAGLSPRQIVAMTFTKKAAAEMRQRLRDECQRNMIAGDAEQARRWRRTSSELETAHIGTIHSFCGTLLRMHALDAGVDPMFGTLEGRPAALLLHRAIGTAFIERLNRQEWSAIKLAAVWSRSTIVSEIAGIIGAREQYLEYLACPPTAEQLLADWERDIEQARIAAALAAGSDNTLAAHLEQLRQLAEPNPTARFAAEALSAIEETAALRTCEPVRAPEHLRAAERAAAVRKGGKAAGWADPDDYESLKEHLNAVKDIVRGHLAICDIDVSDDVHREAAEMASALWAEAAACLDAYAQAKTARAALDFADLQLLADRLVRENESVRRRCRERYSQVLVDEFQDTNALQDSIIRQLTGFSALSPDAPGPRLFVVGDAKQSIYGFRNADVTVFQRARDEFAGGAEGVEAHALQAAFRSTRTLVEFHNWLFSDDAVMGLLGGRTAARREAYEAGYEPLQAMRAEREDGMAGEVLMTDLMPPESGEDASAAENREAEAANLAARLRQMLDEGFLVGYPGHNPRPVQPGDIAILFRSTTSITFYENALRRYGIRFKTVVGRGFWYRPEIMDLLNIIRVLDNSRDGISLMGVLRSPMFGFDDNDLYRIATADIDLRSGLRTLASVGSGTEAGAQTARKARAAENLLEELRVLAGQAPLAVLLEHIIDRTGYSAAMAAQYGGARALANIHKFIDLAREFEQEGGYSLSEFINYTTTIAGLDDREGEALVAVEDEQLVQLLTIHQAKGLQWPVVVIADADAVPGDSRGRTAASERYGICPKKADDGEESQSVGFAKIIRMHEDARARAESRRLLYVAATRAEDYLLISASLPKPGAKPRDSWLQWIACAAGWDIDQRSVAPIAGDGEWTMDARVLEPTELPPAGGRLRSAAVEHREQLLAAEPFGDAPLPEQLRRRVLPVPISLASLQAVPITGLAYLRDDRERFLDDWLRGKIVIDDRWGLSRLDGAGAGIDVGNFAHLVLEMLGREGAEGLEGALQAARHSPQASGILAPRQIQDVADWVSDYLGSSTYREIVACCERLRSEAVVSFIIDGVAIEGKIDALAQMANGALHVLDYKTGQPRTSDGFGAYEFQIGLYCEAVRRALGRLPESATVVYLGPECTCVPLSVAEVVDEAVSEATRLLAELKQGA